MKEQDKSATANIKAKQETQNSVDIINITCQCRQRTGEEKKTFLYLCRLLTFHVYFSDLLAELLCNMPN